MPMLLDYSWADKLLQEMLIAMLDEHCMECNRSLSQEPSGSLEPISAFDFVYLPIDFKNRCNLGYAFVNLTTPQATRRLHRAFHGRQWDEFNSRKICEVSYARLQGREALEEHFKNSRFICDMDEYLPVKFCPPRSGWPISSLSRGLSARGAENAADSDIGAERKNVIVEDRGDKTGESGEGVGETFPSPSDGHSNTVTSRISTTPSTSEAPISTASTILSHGITLGRRVHGYRYGAGILPHHHHHHHHSRLA